MEATKRREKECVWEVCWPEWTSKERVKSNQIKHPVATMYDMERIEIGNRLSPELEKSLVFPVQSTHMDEISYLEILPYDETWAKSNEGMCVAGM